MSGIVCCICIVVFNLIVLNELSTFNLILIHLDRCIFVVFYKFCCFSVNSFTSKFL